MFRIVVEVVRLLELSDFGVDNRLQRDRPGDFRLPRVPDKRSSLGESSEQPAQEVEFYQMPANHPNADWMTLRNPIHVNESETSMRRQIFGLVRLDSIRMRVIRPAISSGPLIPRLCRGPGRSGLSVVRFLEGGSWIARAGSCGVRGREVSQIQALDCR